jgi:hypothetical protein
MFEPISAGLGVGNLLFGMGDRERQKTREHQAAMLQAEQTRMSPWLEKAGAESASAQARSLMGKQEDPMGAGLAGATSIWAQLQKNQQAEEMAKQAAAKSELEDRYMNALIEKAGR